MTCSEIAREQILQDEAALVMAGRQLPAPVVGEVGITEVLVLSNRVAVPIQVTPGTDRETDFQIVMPCGDLELVAPPSFDGEAFKRWELDGFSQAEGVVTLGFRADECHTAFAVYGPIIEPPCDLGDICTNGTRPFWAPDNLRLQLVEYLDLGSPDTGLGDSKAVRQALVEALGKNWTLPYVSAGHFENGCAQYLAPSNCCSDWNECSDDANCAGGVSEPCVYFEFEPSCGRPFFQYTRSLPSNSCGQNTTNHDEHRRFWTDEGWCIKPPRVLFSDVQCEPLGGTLYRVTGSWKMQLSARALRASTLQCSMVVPPGGLCSNGSYIEVLDQFSRISMHIGTITGGGVAHSESSVDIDETVSVSGPISECERCREAIRVALRGLTSPWVGNLATAGNPSGFLYWFRMAVWL